MTLPIFASAMMYMYVCIYSQKNMARIIDFLMYIGITSMTWLYFKKCANTCECFAVKR